MNEKNFAFFCSVYFFILRVNKLITPYNSVHLCKRGTIRIHDSRNRFSVSDLLSQLLFCVCIMHNGAHHRISISSFCTHAEKSFCIEQAREALFFSLRRGRGPHLSLTSNRRRHRQRLQEGDEGDDTCAKVKMYGPRAREPISPRATLVKEILITRYVTRGEVRNAEGPLISSRCHFVKPSGDTLPFLR